MCFCVIFVIIILLERGSDKFMYKSEEEFLAHYDPSMFEKLSLTTDVMIVSVSDQEVSNYRKNSKKKMSILLVKRGDYPYKDMWCLPGGFIDPLTETLDDGAKRVLLNETNLHDIYLEQLYTFGDVKRDPRMRVVSVSFMALVDKNRLGNKLSDNASWFDVTYMEEDDIVSIVLDNGNEQISFRIKKELKDLTTDRYGFKILENKKMAFDHPLIVLSGLERLKNKVDYTDIVFNMMPEYFTLGELQQVYEVILNKKLLDPAFRRIIADKVEKTDMLKTGEGHRPSYLFRYKKRKS